MQSLGIGLPLANVPAPQHLLVEIFSLGFRILPVEDTRGTAKSLSIDRDALLNLDGVGGGNALGDVALLGSLGAPG